MYHTTHNNFTWNIIKGGALLPSRIVQIQSYVPTPLLTRQERVYGTNGMHGHAASIGGSAWFNVAHYLSFPRNSFLSHGIPWKISWYSTEFHGTPWNISWSMPWNSTQNSRKMLGLRLPGFMHSVRVRVGYRFHEIPWNSMRHFVKLHGTPWNVSWIFWNSWKSMKCSMKILEFHEIRWLASFSRGLSC